MNFLKQFYYKTVKYDLINKFSYKNTKELPILKKIVLNFNCKSIEIKQLSTCLLALELITNQKGLLIVSKKPHLSLKIRKGNPIGCKVTLKNSNMFFFLSKLIIQIFPKLKNFKGFIIKKKSKKNSFSFELLDIFNFKELEDQYHLFYNLPKLNITLVTNSKTVEELLFIFKSFQLPIKNFKANITQLVECNLAKIKAEGSNPFIC